MCRLGLLAHPTELQGRLILGQALLRLERYDEVLAEMRVVLEIDPETALGLALRGEALLRKGDNVQAQENLARAVAIEPGNANARRLLSEAGGAPRRQGGLGEPADTRLYSPEELVRASSSQSDRHTPTGHTPPPEVLALPQETPPKGDPTIVVPTSAAFLGDDDDTELLEIASVDVLDVDEEHSFANKQGDHSTVEADRDTLLAAVAMMNADSVDEASPSTGPDLGASSAAVDAVFSTNDADLEASAAVIDELFAEEEEVESSGPRPTAVPPPPPSARVQAQPAHVSASPTRSQASDARSPVPDTRDSSPSGLNEARRSVTEDMRVIRAGLGLDNTEPPAALAASHNRAVPERKQPDRPAVASSDGEPPATPRASPQGRSRPKGRVARRRLGMVLAGYGLVACGIGTGAVWAGYQIREVRLENQIHAVTSEASQLLDGDTYVGYRQAREAYARIYAARRSSGDLAAQLRIEGALLLEFGEGRENARQALDELGDGDSADSLAARAYWRLAIGDGEAAISLARSLVTQYPGDRDGPYLLGRGLLWLGNGGEAVTAFRSALRKHQRPFVYIGLGRAHAAAGRPHEALTALDRAEDVCSDRVCGAGPTRRMHANTLVARGRLLAASPELRVAEGRINKVAGQLEKLLQRPAAALSESQRGWAALAAAELRLVAGQRAQAIAHAARAREFTREGNVPLVDALVALLLRLGDREAAEAVSKLGAGKWGSPAAATVVEAEVALARGDASAALALLEKVAKPGPRVLDLRARAHIAKGHFESAAQALDVAAGIKPPRKLLAITVAELELRRGQAAQARDRLAELYTAVVDPRLALLYSEALRRTGKPEKARSVLSSVPGDPRPARASLELARLERELGNWKAARQAYAAALAQDPKLVVATIEAAALELDLGAADVAQASLDKATEEFPKNWRVLIEAARVHTVRGGVQRAGQLLQRASERTALPRWLLARERGRLALRNRFSRKALSELRNAISLRPDHAQNYLLLVNAHIQLDATDKDRALRLVREEVAKRFGGKWEEAMIRGHYLFAVDERREALAAFNTALKRMTKARMPPRVMSEASFKIGHIYYLEGNQRAALSALKRAVSLNPEHRDAFLFQGLVHLEAKNWRAALEPLERTVTLDPKGNPEAWFYLGEVAKNLSKSNRAREAFTTYIKLMPQGSYVEQAQALLKQL